MPAIGVIFAGRMKLRTVFIIWVLVQLLSAERGFAASSEQTALRDSAALAMRTVPSTQPATGITADGVQALFFTGPDYQHKPTRVFAWIGMPADSKPGQKVPAMVLIHGGGGTAFVEWVRLWNARGYAAIAMDTCGCVPIGSDNHWQRDPNGGPPGWGGFEQIDKPAADQWTYHAALDVILAHSLMRSCPMVDAHHIGVTGISWGGYLACIAAGLDDRFEFACPVYGCGFLGDNSAWLGDLKAMGPVRSSQWLKAWDPSEYLPNAKMPMLWVDGTNDVFYPLDSLEKSYVLPKGPRTLVMRVAMKHSHRDGWSPPEMGTFADSFCGMGAPLAVITSQQTERNVLSAHYKSSRPIRTAELNFTLDRGEFSKRRWQVQPAQLLLEARTARADIPQKATAFYVNLFDDRGSIVSTDLVLARQ
jgi:dienelactone hydrolase